MEQVPKRKLKTIRCSVLLWNSPIWVLSIPLHIPNQKENTKQNMGMEPCIAMARVKSFFSRKNKTLENPFPSRKKHRLKNLIRWSLYLATTCFPVSTELTWKKAKTGPTRTIIFWQRTSHIWSPRQLDTE